MATEHAFHVAQLIAPVRWEHHQIERLAQELDAFAEKISERAVRNSERLKRLRRHNRELNRAILEAKLLAKKRQREIERLQALLAAKDRE